MPRYNHLIAANITSLQQSKALRNWIKNREFEKYESTQYALGHKGGRPKNKLYKFLLADINRQVIMKVFYINKRYKWTRQFESILKYYLRDTNHAAFRCCERAYAHNLAAPEPFAYWKKRDSLTRVKSYFLYQYIEADFQVEEIYGQLVEAGGIDSKQKRALIKQKIIDALKSLHRQGIRHGDVVLHNMVMPVENTDNLSSARVYFIDCDKASFTKIKYPAFIRRFFDLRDLRKITIDDVSHHDILKLYLGSDYHAGWNMVLAFWRWGGFNLFQWRNPDTRQIKNHMR